MRQLLYSLLFLGLAACSDNAGQQVHTTQPAAAATPAGTVRADGSLQPQALKLADIPVTLRLPGKLLEAWRWPDANGENLLVVFRQEHLATDSGEETAELPEQSAELQARQYVQRTGSWQELWRLQDAVTDCPFDMWLGPLPGSTSITDLDHDGQSETTLIYKLTCRSDVSPSRLKLVLREGATKYALRGYTVVQSDSVPVSKRAPANPCCLDTISKRELDAPNGFYLLDGRYETEREFKSAPPAFLRFARQQWRKWSVRDDFEQL